MPRKPVSISHSFPYHIRARSNNKEWFYLPIERCWTIFEELLLEVNQRFNFHTHAFVLMDNHYHLIGSASLEHPLPRVMEWYQRSANRIINAEAGRINHLFGGPYRASLLANEFYFYHAVKYVLRNPVEARICEKVEDYKFSSLRHCRIPIVYPTTGIEKYIPKNEPEFLKFLNISYTEKAKSVVGKAMGRVEMNFPTRLPQYIKDELHLRERSQKGSAYL